MPQHSRSRHLRALCITLITGMLLLSSCGDKGDTFRIKWSYDVGSDTYVYYSSAALSEDEQTIYVGTSKKVGRDSSRKDSLLALNNDGSLKWKYALTRGEEVRSSPVVASHTVCFLADFRTGSRTKDYTNLVCLHESDGALSFEREISNNSIAFDLGLSKVIIKDNKVFAVMKYFYVFDITTGTELYRSEQLQTEDEYINPVVLADDIVFMLRQTLYTISMTDYAMSSVLISTSSTAGILATPAIDSNDNIYIGTDGGQFIAMNSSGNLLWEKDVHASVRSSAAIDESHGLIYFGTKDNDKSKFIALSLSTGEIQWEYKTGGDVYSSPLIGNNGRIYVGSESNYLYAFNSNGEVAWKVGVSQDITWPSPTIDSQGVIYIGGMGGKIFAIQSDSTGLMPGAWSKIHKNNQNTGF
jgi:outer membrane protein assembly factor BamB